MKTKDLALQIAGTIFGLVAIVHILRIITGAAVIIAGWTLPIWFNYAGFIGATFLCIWLWVVSFIKVGDAPKYYSDKHRYK